MGRIEIDGGEIFAHAQNEGIQSSGLIGTLKFVHPPEGGVAVALDIETLGDKNGEHLPAIRALLMRNLNTGPVQISIDGKSVSLIEPPGWIKRMSRLPAAKRAYVQPGQFRTTGGSSE